MNLANRCPSCGADRPAGSPEGPCPHCLSQQATEPDPQCTDARSVLDDLATTIGPLPRVLLVDDIPTAHQTPPVARPTSTEMPALINRTARLQLAGEIARGGMGAVLRGRDVDLGRELAVKVLLEVHQHKPEMVRRFVEEAQIGGQLQHPGIVPVYELGAFADRRPFFTMKLVKGRTLAELLRERFNPADDRPRFLGIFAQVCQTMAYAHARGVIHRDLKPSNVMVGSFGEVQVMDWGLAKVLSRGGTADDAGAGNDPSENTIIATARAGEGSDLSQVGSVLGTPAYMAPEQARGEGNQVDERADVFALGSILCEIMTGRPAFTGRSTGEIHRKSALGDTAEALGLLDGYGADGELVALASDSLAREREDRPRDAGALAARVTAYLSGVQERLRQAEIARARAEARAEEERKRRRLALALAASVVLLTTLGGAGAAVYWQQRHAQASRLAVAVRGVELLHDQAQSDPQGDPARWRAAVAAAEHAVDLLGPLADARSRREVQDLLGKVRRQADDAEADAKLLREVVDIRSAEADDPDGSTSDAVYESAFRDAGMDVDTLGFEVIGARIRSRPAGVALALVAALDHWAGRRRLARPRDEAAWGRLVAAARAADPDPIRDRLRDLWGQGDRKAQRGPLLELASKADPREWPPASLLLLAEALASAGASDAAIDLLRRAAAHQPGDVWLSYRLAAWLETMQPPRTEEAIGYYRAARALRPETAHDLAHLLEGRGRGGEAAAVFEELVRLRPMDGRHWACYGHLLKDRGDRGAAAVLEKAVGVCREAIRGPRHLAGDHVSLGVALSLQGKLAEAAAEFREVVRDQPEAMTARVDLGSVLRELGQHEEAVKVLREAIRLQPEIARAHSQLGVVLVRQRKLDEAIAAFREAIRLRPDYAEARNNLANALQDQGLHDEAISTIREAIRLKPDDALAHYNLGNFERDRGKPDDAIAAYRESIRLKPDYSWTYNNLGVVLLDSKHDLKGAEAAYRAAIQYQPDYARAFGGLGRVLTAQGRLDDAVAAFRESIRLKPDVPDPHLGLGEALKQRGQFREALAVYRKAHDLASSHPGPHEPWAATIRQVERLADLESRLPNLLRDLGRPTDGVDRLELAGAAHELKRHALAARLYLEAFRADPALSSGPNSANCYTSACAAAMAAAGRGVDPLTDPAEKARWRKQAVAWLRVDLDFWAGQAAAGTPEAKAVVASELAQWKAEPDLAAIRDEPAIKAMPIDEQKACRSLWADVESRLAPKPRP